ncbi:hypothetical protein H6F67_06670 [Microcoleus sp. FACHB-1515]|uniref:hypothetical protein n=1 Tax=Cyanophyceae TaxID=3028117 RepID=UPI001684ECDC|nr:hypothetical protein [Microcoleus sp. FACHB-1515]MBD2089535.1 hypothetical protein [Microcoleus sp. FACHB-1515]
MSMKLRGIFTGLTIAMAASSIGNVAAAQTVNPSDPPRPLNDEFLRAFYANDGNFYQNRRLGRQIDFVLGVGTNFLNSFTDNEIAGDGRAVDRLYREALRDQTLSDGIIRTPDQENPFDTSLLLLPASSATLSTVNDIPPVPVVPFSPPPAPVPEVAPPAAPSAPVPALW